MRNFGSKSIVAKNGTRKTVVAEGISENVPCGGHGEIRAAAQRHRKTRMIVDSRKREDASAFDLKRPLVIALPKLIAFGAFEKLNGLWSRAAYTQHRLRGVQMNFGQSWFHVLFHLLLPMA